MAAIYALALAPDGLYSAAADGFIVHWHRDDVDFGRVVAKVENGKFFSLATLEDGGLVAGAVDGGVHWLYPTATERNRHVAFHTRGVYAVVRLGTEVLTGGGDGVLGRWDASTGRLIESVQLSGNSLRCIAPYDGGALLLIGGSDGKVHILDRSSFKLIDSRPANDPSTFTVASLPDGSPAYVSGGRDARLRFGRPGHDGTPGLPTIDAHLATVNALAFSPGGHYLATASRDKTVKLWKAADRSFELLKVAEVVRDRGHVNSVNCLLWADDRTLYTSGDDRRILEWRVG